MTKHSVCTLGLALAMSLSPGAYLEAASHCKGLEEALCGSTAACKWNPQRESKKWFNKEGQPQTTKAHCRLDVAAAAKIAADMAKR